MKTLTGVLISAFLAVMILGGAGPTLLYGCDTSGGTPWDTCINCWCLDLNPNATGTKLDATVSVYYLPRSSGGYDAYFTLRYSKGFQLNVYRETSQQPAPPYPPYVVYDAANETGIYLCNFIDSAMKQQFPNNRGWSVKSYTNPWGTYGQDPVGSRAFVTDISIAVRE